MSYNQPFTRHRVYQEFQHGLLTRTAIDFYETLMGVSNGYKIWL